MRTDRGDERMRLGIIKASHDFVCSRRVLGTELMAEEKTVLAYYAEIPPTLGNK